MRIMIGVTSMALLAGAASAQEPARPFNPDSDPLFARATPTLKRYLQGAVPRPRGPQHFCIIGYRIGADRQAWVHWEEGHALVAWWGHSDPAFPDDSLAMSHRQLDLNTDVVPTDEAIGGSTYLISKPRLDRTLADCRAVGARYTVPAPKRKVEGGE